MAGWLRQVPGFRSGKRWKQATALLGYMMIALFIIAGLSGAVGVLVLGLEVLLLVFLASNAWNLRSSTPVLNSTSKLQSVAGWIGLIFLFLILFGVATPSKPAVSPSDKGQPVTIQQGLPDPATASLASTTTAKLQDTPVQPLVQPAAQVTATGLAVPTVALSPTSIPIPIPTTPLTAVPSTSTSKPAPPPTSTPPAPALPLVTVAEVVDGDTIKLQLAGRMESIRIIGIDTPEVVDPRQPVQCFGREASTKATELLSGQQVRLIPDPTQGERDGYGRLLRYVERGDGLDFGLWMIENGYAHEYTYNIPYQRQAAYKTAYRQAREKNAGLWAADTCNGNTKQPASPSSQTIVASPTVAVAPVPTATATPTQIPTATPRPTATQVPAPAAALSLEIVSVTSPVRPGGRATLVAKTVPGANASITVYYKSGPSTAQGLVPKVADANGNVSWTWMVGTRTTPGTWRIVVSASLGSNRVTKETSFVVSR